MRSLAFILALSAAPAAAVRGALDAEATAKDAAAETATAAAQAVGASASSSRFQSQVSVEYQNRVGTMLAFTEKLEAKLRNTVRILEETQQMLDAHAARRQEETNEEKQTSGHEAQAHQADAQLPAKPLDEAHVAAQLPSSENTAPHSNASGVVALKQEVPSAGAAVGNYAVSRNDVYVEGGTPSALAEIGESAQVKSYAAELRAARLLHSQKVREHREAELRAQARQRRIQARRERVRKRSAPGHSLSQFRQTLRKQRALSQSQHQQHQVKDVQHSWYH